MSATARSYDNDDDSDAIIISNANVNRSSVCSDENLHGIYSSRAGDRAAAEPFEVELSCSASSYILLPNHTSSSSSLSSSGGRKTRRSGIINQLKELEEEEENEEVTKAKFQSSNVTAFVTLLKALFGVSLLSSPRVLGETGLVLGTVVYTLIVLAVVGSCWCLLQARAKAASDIAIQAQAPTATTSPSKSTTTSISTQSSLGVKPITYSDLGRIFLGAKQSTLISFLIVSLHILFGAGLVSTSMRQVAIVLGWEVEEQENSNEEDNNNDDNNNNNNDDDDSWFMGRMILACIFFPIIATLLQFRNIKDLFWVCLAGLLVFLVGCVGTMLYSSTLNDNNNDGYNIWDIPQDALEWKWSGIPNFVASTLCAMEGINLALPIANQFYLATATATTVTATALPKMIHLYPNNNNNNNIGMDGDSLNKSPVPVVTAAVSVFGVTTLLVAYFGFLSGLAGGSDEVQRYCPSAAHCLDSDLLQTIHRLSLTVALILTLPIILYPSLELLECWADERHRQLKTGKTSTNEALGNSWNGFVMGSPPDSLQRKLQIEELLFGVDPYFKCLHKHWRYRISHAAAVCLLAVVDRQWERGFVLYKGIGLSIACFLLPVLLFVKAYTLPVVLQKTVLATALSGLVALGLVNFVLVTLSVFTKHNFMPTEIHDDPLHHHHEGGGDDGSGD